MISKSTKISLMAMTICAATITGCSKKSTENTTKSNPAPTAAEISVAPGGYLNSRPLSAVMKATLFKMSGDYADRVAVTLSPSGTLTYFPAPTDINLQAKPRYVGDGWWLNRQGLSANSVFTKWTFEEYAALDQVPTPGEIKSAIIPDAMVTDFCQLPVLASEAESMNAQELLALIPR